MKFPENSNFFDDLGTLASQGIVEYKSTHQNQLKKLNISSSKFNFESSYSLCEDLLKCKKLKFYRGYLQILATEKLKKMFDLKVDLALKKNFGGLNVDFSLGLVDCKNDIFYDLERLKNQFNSIDNFNQPIELFYKLVRSFPKPIKLYSQIPNQIIILN